jgi:hypothetical protein
LSFELKTNLEVANCLFLFKKPSKVRLLCLRQIPERADQRERRACVVEKRDFIHPKADPMTLTPHVLLFVLETTTRFHELAKYPRRHIDLRECYFPKLCDELTDITWADLMARPLPAMSIKRGQKPSMSRFGGRALGQLGAVAPADGRGIQAGA